MAFQSMSAHFDRVARKPSVHPSHDAQAISTIDGNLPPPEDGTSPAPSARDVESGETPTRWREDEIGVTLDYEPQNPDGIVHESATPGSTSGNEEANDGDSSRRRRQSESPESEQQGRRRSGFIRFYSQHWLGQFMSGIFTGLIFFTIGIVFIVYFTYLPTYIGVLFLLVSFPPCCMAINRWRYARLQHQQRVTQMERLNAIRRHQRQRRATTRDDGTPLPFSENPPSYNNLAFVGEQPVGLYAHSNGGNSSVSLCTDIISPPTYDDVVKLKEMLEEERLREESRSAVVPEEPPGTVRQTQDPVPNEPGSSETP